MPAEDFARWNELHQRWTGPTAAAAREAWLAAEARLLDPAGRPLPEVVAQEVLKGEHGDLAVLVDWLEERDLLEPIYLQCLTSARARDREIVTHLAGGIACDLNSLFTVICGYGELLLHHTETPEQTRACLEEIRRATERSVSLIRQLLAFTRGSPPFPKPVDLRELLLNLDRVLRRLLGAGIELAIDLEPDLPRVSGNPGQIEQMLMALTDNSRSAMPDSGRLSIEARNVELGPVDRVSRQPVRPGRYVLLAVRDTGCGMTPEVLARAFEAFFTTKVRSGAAGVGLATVAATARALRGYAEIESTSGQGSTVRIYLPAADETGAEST